MNILKYKNCIPVGCVPAARRPYGTVCSRRGSWFWGGTGHGGVCGPGEGVSTSGGCMVWGVWSRGVYGLVGCLVRGVWGVSAPRGGCIPACTEADTPPPWTEFLTHACENITLAQLRLRPVTTRSIVFSEQMEHLKFLVQDFPATDTKKTKQTHKSLYQFVQILQWLKPNLLTVPELWILPWFCDRQSALYVAVLVGEENS